MILWNAFYQYFLRSGAAPRSITVGILSGLFLLHRFGFIEKIKRVLAKVTPRQWFFLILLLGLGLRIAWIAWSPYSPPAAGTEDGIMIRHARELINGTGYITPDGKPTAERPVGYALLLAGIFRVVGENLDFVAVLNALMAIVTLWLLYKTGAAVASEFVGLFAAFLLAIYPTSIFANRIVLEEPFFIPMWLGGIYLLILDYQKPSFRKVFGAAVLFAVAAHFRTFSFAMGFVAFLMWFFFKKNFVQALGRLLLIQGLVFLVALPWAMRNQRIMGQPVFFSTAVGLALYCSNNQKSDVRYPVYPSLEEGGDVAFLTAQNEFDRSRAGKQAALRWITANPGVFVQKALGRVIYMLGLSREGWTVKDNFYTIRAGRSRPSEKMIAKFNRLDNDFYGVIFLLAFFGLIVLIFSKIRVRPYPGMGYLLLTLIYYLAMIAITLGHRKYRFPIEPIFCLWAAYGISFFTAPKLLKGKS